MSQHRIISPERTGIHHKKKKRNRSPLQESLQEESALQQAVELFPDGKLNRVLDPQFSTPSRQRAARRLGDVMGNRRMQRLMAEEYFDQKRSNPTALQRSPIQRSIRKWFKKLLGSDPEGAVRETDTWLGRASQVTGFAAGKITDEKINKALQQLKNGLDGLKGATSGIVNVLNKRKKVRKLWAFASALESVPDDIAADPDKAAKAFGKVFTTAGDLGDLLPPGPWTPYFQWLQKSGTFFSDMLYGLDPAKRGSTRRLEEEVKRGGQPPLIPK